MILFVLQRQFSLSDPITHMGLKIRQGGTVPFTASQPSSSHSGTTCHPILSIKWFLFLISLSALSQTHQFSGQVSFLCVSRRFGQRPPQAPSQAAGLTPGSPSSLSSSPALLFTSCSHLPPSLLPQAAFLVFFFFTETLCQVQTLTSYFQSFAAPELYCEFLFPTNFLSCFYWDVFLFWSAFNPVWMFLNSCRTTLKIRPFTYRGPKRLQRLEKLLAASPTHLHRVRLHLLPRGSLFMASFKILTQIKLPLKSMAI